MNGQVINAPKVVIMPDVIQVNVDISDKSGVFYSARCNKSTVITLQENLTGWGEMPKELTNEEERNARTPDEPN